MKKIISLLKACMTQDMSIFKINGKNRKDSTKKFLPIILAIIILVYMYSYAKMIMEPLIQVRMEFVVLTLFVMFTTILTIVEGIYKSSGLLFNCKDDNLLLALPIKKSTVLFIRIFKFYIFEFIYNSLFLIPAMAVYAVHVKVGVSYYITSLSALILLPVIPITLSCIIGCFISLTSSKFKFKNIAQIIITTILLLGVLYLSFNLEVIISNLAQNATSINDIITKIYYPAGLYIKLVTDFSIVNLLIFILINVGIFVLTIFALSMVYFKINSNVKKIKRTNNNSNYKIKTSKPTKALIKKEINRFINSPVFVTNAGFGLVLFVVACILLIIKFDSFGSILTKFNETLSIEKIKTYIPVILFGLICFASLMSSITSSMISLERKAFNILKTIPIKPFKIIKAKIITAVLIMIPFIFIGDIIIFTKFEFNILELIMILIASVIMPLVAETIGILVNLKYPKMDAVNDTEVVKQSISSTIAVFIGMGLVGLTIFVLFKCIENNLPVDIIIASGVGIYTIIYILLLAYLNKISIKEFNNINV